MAKQIVNIGSAERAGDGESIRNAFDKINDNFTELYDVKSDFSSVDRDIVPDTDIAYRLGTPNRRFTDLYLSGNSLHLGDVVLTTDGNSLQLDGVKIITQSELDIAVQNDITTNLNGSVFADDSTLLVDGVNGRIVGPIDTAAEFVGDGPVSFNNDYEGDGFRGGFTTDKSILQIMGADYVGGGDDGGGITISAGLARNDGNRGDVIISTGSGGAEGTGIISLLSDYITAAGTWIGAQTMNINGDVKGSVFADDSTLLVDGVSGTIPASVVSGTITNDISTNSLETITDIRFGTYADARKPKISIAGIGEHDIAITAGYDVNGDDSGNVSINANTDGVTPGWVSIATSSGQLLLGKTGGDIDVFGQVEFHGNILFQDGDGVEFNGPVDFSDATVTGLSLDTVSSLSADVNGSVFADDSTLLVDGVAGKIVGDVDITGGNRIDLDTDNGFYITNTDINTYALTVAYTSNLHQLTASGAVSLASTLSVTGNTALGGNLDVAGDSSTTGNIVVTGLAFVGDSLSVTGDATFSSNVGVSGDLSVAGHLSVLGNTDLKGSIFADDSTLLVDGVNGTLSASRLSQDGAADGQALVWSESNNQWQPGAVAGAGPSVVAMGSVSTGGLVTNSYGVDGAEVRVSPNDIRVNFDPEQTDTNYVVLLTPVRGTTVTVSSATVREKATTYFDVNLGDTDNVSNDFAFDFVVYRI